MQTRNLFTGPRAHHGHFNTCIILCTVYKYSHVCAYVLSACAQWASTTVGVYTVIYKPIIAVLRPGLQLVTVYSRTCTQATAELVMCESN